MNRLPTTITFLFRSTRCVRPKIATRQISIARVNPKNFNTKYLKNPKVVNTVENSRYQEFKNFFFGEDWFANSFLISFPLAFTGSIIFTPYEDKLRDVAFNTFMLTMTGGFWPIGLVFGVGFVVNELKRSF